jgi:hypothetical protein
MMTNSIDELSADYGDELLSLVDDRELTTPQRHLVQQASKVAAYLDFARGRLEQDPEDAATQEVVNKLTTNLLICMPALIDALGDLSSTSFADFARVGAAYNERRLAG